LNEDDVERQDALRQTGADFIVTSLTKAVQKITLAAKPGGPMTPAAPEVGIKPRSAAE
jgi:hypothetical protein